MGVYDNRARRTRDRDLVLIVADRPTQVVRTRKVHIDKMRAPSVLTAGPYTVRIEPFRATRNAVVVDEKGTGATAAYVLVAVSDVVRGWVLPKKIDDEPTFKVDDTLVDTDGNIYRITAPARWDGLSVELNIELVG